MIDKTVSELKKVFSFKKTTREGDIVLIAAEHLLYAMVLDLERDTTRKDEWWHVTMQLLTIPPQKITWTLREPQFSGQEIFTMGGEPRFVAAIDFGAVKPRREAPPPGPRGKAKRPMLTVVK